jgi:pyrroline-5-carboxylate reductase
MIKLGIIGLGQMGEAVAAGLLASSHAKDYSIQGTTRTKESAKDAQARLKILCSTDNRAVARECEILLLCVKPHQAEKVVREISSALTSKKLLVSICASLSTELLLEWSAGKCAVIRAMPNTPCLIGEGMTVFCGSPNAQVAQMGAVSKIFDTLGRTAMIEETLMDGATGLSGCGPAYAYLIIEALSEAGVKVGLPRETATLLAAQTLRGASQMVLDRGVHPAALKDEVTTPAGCTIDGLMALEEGKLRVTLIKAVLAAAKRSRTLRTQAE